MKKLVIGLTISAAVFGGFVIAQFMTEGSATTQTIEETKQITEKEAKEIALQKVNGIITEVEFDLDDRYPHYEFEIQSNNQEIHIHVDATTGVATITEQETAEVANKTPAQTNQINATTRSEEVITTAEAIKIASTVAKGTVTNVEFDSDDDDQTKTYELEFKDGNVEYDVEINAYTGDIIKVEQDLED